MYIAPPLCTQDTYLCIAWLWFQKMGPNIQFKKKSQMDDLFKTVKEHIWNILTHFNTDVLQRAKLCLSR